MSERSDVVTAVFDTPLDDVNVPAANVVIGDTLPTVIIFLQTFEWKCSQH